jgi:SAM-dependent methyltransferase
MKWLREGLGWRWRAYGPRVARFVRRLCGMHETHWARVVMDRETDKLVRGLLKAPLDVLEISGDKWRSFPFASYRNASYPDYDVCREPLVLEGFDLIIAEQVLEHVLWPYRAVRHVWQMLRPGGFFLVTTPFMLRIHDYPVDCSRWTPTGLRHLLAEGGFPLEHIHADAWGNRACVRANLLRWRRWTPWLHSLRNEPDYPVVVWALAKK